MPSPRFAVLLAAAAPAALALPADGARPDSTLKPAGSNASATGVPEGFTPTATCQTECHTYAGDWTVKCKWKDRVNCDGCEECFWRAGGSDSCQANCYTSVVQDWKEKCKWNDQMHCIGCAECGPTASNTQQPQPQPQPQQPAAPAPGTATTGTSTGQKAAGSNASSTGVPEGFTATKTCEEKCYTYAGDWMGHDGKCLWNDRVHCSGCAECGPTASNTQQPQPQQQAHKLSETCQAECYTNTLIWGVKCGWSKTCAGCDECGGASTGTAANTPASNATESNATSAGDAANA